MASSVSSGSTRGNWFLRGAIAAALFSFAWFQGCGIADVKQAGDTTTAQGAGGGSSTGASSVTGQSSTSSGTTDTSSASSATSGTPSTAMGAGGSSTIDTVSVGMGGASVATSGMGGAGVGGAGVGGAGGSAPSNPPSQRVDVVINPAWKFNRADAPGAEAIAFNDAAWTTLDLPHTYNTIDGSNGPTTTPAYYRGIAWYRKHYTIPADMMGKKIYLQFDASAIITDVWLNGMKVGVHAGSYAVFRFDITAAARIGMDNVIAVRVDNSQSVSHGNWVMVPNASTANVPPRTGDFTMYGGIYRDVHILATDPLAINPMDFASPGVYLRTTNVSAAAATLGIRVKLSNGTAAAKMATVEATLVDAAGMNVQTATAMQSVPANGAAEATLSMNVMNPHLWNGVADPYLYKVNAVVKDGTTVTDAVAQGMGFRFYAMNPNTGFSLNGRAYPLRGICMHQDHKDKGNVYLPREIDNDFAMLKEMGVNTVRFAHYQHPQYTYDKADQMGLIGWAENAVVDSINDTPEYLANSRQQLQELIRQNYNHPSLFIWASSNEILLRPSTPNANILAFVTNLHQLSKQEDPDRWTINSCANNAQEDPVNYVTDLAGFNRYNGWYYQRINDFAAWADGKHAMYPNKPIVVAEYGVGASLVQHGLPIVETGTNRQEGIQTEEYAAIFHERYWAMIQTRPFLVWSSLWNMFDFAADYRNEGLVPGLNTKGLVSYDRLTRKDPFYFYKAAWSKEPFVHINYRRFTNMPRSATEIRAYSNQPTVELKLNGVSLGSKTAPDHIFVWTGVTWAAGMNVAEATSGTLIDRVTWTN